MAQVQRWHPHLCTLENSIAEGLFLKLVCLHFVLTFFCLFYIASPSSASDDTGIIIGAAIGAIVVCFVLLLAVYCLTRRRANGAAG